MIVRNRRKKMVVTFLEKKSNKKILITQVILGILIVISLLPLKKNKFRTNIILGITYEKNKSSFNSVNANLYRL